MTSLDGDDAGPPDGAAPDRTPFGVPGLDVRFGGIPSGTAVLLSGHPDAGIQEYTFTSIAGIAGACHAPSRFERRTGFEPSVYGRLPESIRYVSLRMPPATVERAVRQTVGEAAAETLVERLTVESFSERLLACAALPRDSRDRLFGRVDGGTGSPGLGFDADDYGVDALVNDLFDVVADVGDDELLVVDSLTGLLGLEDAGRGDRTHGLVGALTRLSLDRPHFTYLLDYRTDDEIDSSVLSFPTGRLVFSYDDDEIDLRQYLRVGTFSGMLGVDEQVKFRTSVDAEGFRVTDTRTVPARHRPY